MAIIKKKNIPLPRTRIDITGPDGNAFALMAIAKSFCSQLDRDFPPIRSEMMGGDYENLLQVFDREFGEFCDLVR